MKLCLFVSTVEDPSELSQFLGASLSQLENDQHQIEVKTVDGLNFKEQFKAAAAQDFDLHFILLQKIASDGTSNEEVINHFQSLGLPSCGTRGYGSQVLKESNETNCPDQLLSCNIIQIGTGCLALPPFTISEPIRTNKENDFDSLNTTSENAVEARVLVKKHDAVLFERVQKAAIDCFIAYDCRRGNLGCTVDLRIRPDGTVLAVGIDPRPFKGINHCHHLPIIQSFPGGQRALMDTFVANHLLGSGPMVETRDKLAKEYTAGAVTYEDVVANSNVPATMKDIAEKFDYRGIVFDLACGTGIFARALRAREDNTAADSKCQLFGFDIAPGMLEVCKTFNVYDQLHVDSMEETLLNFRQYAPHIDHMVCFTATMFLRRELFTLFLVLAFALTRKSITFSIVDIPEKYNDWLREVGLGHLNSINHLKGLEDFGVPPGWSMRWSHKEFVWKNPMSGHDIYATIFRFERHVDGVADVMLGKWGV